MTDTTKTEKASPAAHTGPRYSIVVPAYKECGNIEPLVKRVFAALKENLFKDGDVEMIIIDDNSKDGTVEAVEKLEKEGYLVSVDVRTTERGLSSAVIHGLNKAKGIVRVVMDADLQHPPEAVPSMLLAFSKPGVQFACGTRYLHEAQVDKDWPMHRRFISWGARMLARPLTMLSDPMSGFFGIRKEVYEQALPDVNPIGYKIALELYVKSYITKFEEVPFTFGTRTVGESKLTTKVIVNYLEHLYALYKYKYGPVLYLIIACLIGAFIYAYYYVRSFF